MAIWHKQVSTGIDSVVDNAEIVALHRRWIREDELADGLPPLSGFAPQALGALGDKVMLLRPEGEDFRYVHYGSEIQRHAQFDMTGRPVSDFGGELGEFFLARYREVLAGGRPLYTVHFSDRAPAVLTWERLILPLRDADGQPWLVVYNQPLESRQQLLEAVLNATSDGIVALRPLRDAQGVQVDWLVVMVNRQFSELLGCPFENPIGRSVAEAFPAWPQLALDERCRAAMAQAGGLSGELTLPLAGRALSFLIEIGPLGDGCVLRLAAITERKRAEEALREREQLLQQLFDNSLDGILYTDGQRHILDANPAACAMLGRSRDELRRGDGNDFIDQQDPRLQAALDERERSGQFKGQLRLRRGDGTAFEAELFSALHVDCNGQARATVNVRDISARVAAEAERARLAERLREAQQLEAIGTLARGIAHDFNNILGAMLANVVLARQDVEAAHPARLALDELLKSGTRAKELVAQILTFSRQGHEPFVRLPLRPVAEEVSQTLRTLLPAGCAITLRAEPAACRVWAHPAQLHQVLMNLGVNALHAVEAAPDRPGRIAFELDEVLLDAAAVQALPGLAPGRHVRVAVRDNGAGIDPAVRGRIFEPFYTTKPLGKGTGLGLSVVHGIVGTHGGAIAVDSTPGVGSCFTIYLPALDASAEAPAPLADDGAAAAGRGEHVLCVDDDETMLLVLQRLLERCGYRVTAFGNAEAAVAAVRERPREFDLVVTDCHMPALDGLRVAAEITKLRPDLPVLMYSGHVSDELRIDARRAGVRRVVAKADSYDELPAAVRQLLGPA